MALPEPGITPALGSEILRGWDLEAWRNWRTLLRRTPADAAEERRRLGLASPYSDPALVRRPRVYAKFIVDLHARSLITFKPAAVNTVGLFFVPKKLKNNTDLRLILDTRLANCDFLPPWHTALPSAAAWSGLELNADDPLLLAQTDVNNAFYRIGVPAGLEECFLLPQVKASLLTELGIVLPEEVAADAVVSPALTVLAMGFSWSLYFCQRMVEACVENCGISRHQFARDRQPAPRIDEGELSGAVYVDGAAILGIDGDKVDSNIAAVKEALDQVGLQCPNLELSGKDQI